MADNSVFISYRRDPGYPWARLIWENLGDKGVDAFLDLESMRAAGRFDDRLLNQIASRPYFIAILTARTLDRCASPDDWMRREIEHAIDTNRIIVPTFIAPFEPSGFPADLPSHIDKALSQSQGLTVYSQYLSAATDKLADELLAPVEMESIGLTEEDARFQSRAIRQVRALPPPPLPPTPIAEPDGTDTDTDTDTDAIGTAAPAVAAGVISADTPDAPNEPPDTTPTDTHDAPTEPPETTPTDTHGVPTEPGTPDAPTEPRETTATDAVVAPAVETEVAADSGPVTSLDAGPARSSATDSVSAAPPAARASTSTGESDDSTRRRRRLLGGGVVAAIVIAAVAAVVVFSQGDDGPSTVLEAGTWLEPGDAVRSPNGAHELVMTSSGRLRLRTGGTIVWEPNYSPTSTAAAIVQPSDGNFVVYRSTDPESGALWASGTTDVGPGGTLRVIDESGAGFVVIEDADGIRRWREPERTNDPPPAATQQGTTATVPPPEETAATNPSTDTAEERLRSIVERDTQIVDQAVDAWVVQLERETRRPRGRRRRAVDPRSNRRGVRHVERPERDVPRQRSRLQPQPGPPARFLSNRLLGLVLLPGAARRPAVRVA